MKFFKRIMVFSGLITFFCAGVTMAVAADNLEDAIKNGKTSGEVKIWYQTNDHDGNDKDIFEKENTFFDAGIRLGYTTDSFYGFKAGATFYAIDDLNAYGHFADKSMMGTPENETRTWLGEAYLSYNLCYTTVSRLDGRTLNHHL